MSELRDKLLEIEPLSVDRNENLKQEIQAMFETKMSQWEKWYWGMGAAGSVFYVACAIVIVCFAPVGAGERMIWAASGAANALVAAFLFWRLRKGSMDLRQQFALGKAAVGVMLAITMLILIYAIGHPTLENLAWGLVGVTAFVLAAAIAIHNRVLAAELSSRERSLQLEYRLAELLEKLGERR